MSLLGTYNDTYKDMWNDMYLQESQDKGSRLRQIVLSEMMEGDKNYFIKTGKVEATDVTARLQQRVYSAQTFEKRQVEGTMSEYVTAIDVVDLVKNIANPKTALMMNAVNALGRKVDDVIMNAISGNVIVTNDGSSSNQGLTLSVAVDDHTYDSGAGDVGLTVSKLKKALGDMSEAYGYDGTQRLICVAPYKQILNLTQDDQFVSSDYRTKNPLEGPGVIRAASGFMDIDFIAFERCGLDSNGDQKAFLLTDDAIKLGIFKPLTSKVYIDDGIAGSPEAFATWEMIGAARLHEEKVVEIACNPIA